MVAVTATVVPKLSYHSTNSSNNNQKKKVIRAYIALSLVSGEPFAALYTCFHTALMFRFMALYNSVFNHVNIFFMVFRQIMITDYSVFSVSDERPIPGSFFVQMRQRLYPT